MTGIWTRWQRVLDEILPIQPTDDQLIGRYYREGTRFLLAAGDRDVKRVSDLVRDGKAMSLPELHRVMFLTQEDIDRMIANIAAAFDAADAVPIREVLTGRLSAAIEKHCEHDHEPA